MNQKHPSKSHPIPMTTHRMILFMKFQKRQNYSNKKQLSGCHDQGLVKGRSMRHEENVLRVEMPHITIVDESLTTRSAEESVGQ